MLFNFCLKKQKVSIPCLVRWVLGLGVVIFVSLFGYFKNKTGVVTYSPLEFPDHSQITAQFFSKKNVPKTNLLSLELVNTASSIAQGLSDRTSLGADGMLFIFANRLVPKFWMKDMLFDLDIVWLDRGRVVDLTTDIQAPDPTTPLHQLPTYSPSQSVNMVLELPAGAVKAYDLQIGDLIQL